MQSELVCAQSSYPRPERLDRNIRYARILLASYSGPTSELTDVHRYAYHCLMAQRDHPEAADCLRAIAKVEARHLELLGEWIGKLGLYPTYGFYQGTRRVRWNSGFVRYGHNLRDMIEINLREENSAIAQYQQAARHIPEPRIQALLHRIIQDEELHIRELSALRHRLWPRGGEYAPD